MRSSDASTRAEPCSASTASQTGAVSCSSTDVRRRNVRSSGVERREELGAEVLRQEAIVPARNCVRRSSPARSRAASAPRRMPAAQPSQRSSRSAASSSVSAASGARRSASLSRGLSARSAARNSSSFPPARSRAIGTPGEAAHERQRGSRRNVVGQGRERLGRVAGAEQVSVVDHEHEVPGRAQPGCEPRQFGRPVLRPARGVTGGASAGRMPSSAAASRPSRTAASSSVSSTESHAQGRRSRSAHCAASVVLPYPAGAVSGHEGRRRRTQPVHERRPRHRPGRRGRHANLCFDDVRRLGSRSPGARARHPFSMGAPPRGSRAGAPLFPGGSAPVPVCAPPPPREQRRRGAGPSTRAGRSAACRER